MNIEDLQKLLVHARDFLRLQAQDAEDGNAFVGDDEGQQISMTRMTSCRVSSSPLRHAASAASSVEGGGWGREGPRGGEWETCPDDGEAAKTSVGSLGDVGSKVVCTHVLPAAGDENVLASVR